MNIEIAETTAPSIMPMMGTSREDRRETRRSSAKKTMVPANAKAMAQVMRTRIGAPGQAIMMVSRPSPAHSVVPVVEGSAKRFWVTSCMTSPLMDMAAPERMRAIVRGTRTARKIRQPSSWDRIEYSPVDRIRGRGRLDEAVAGVIGAAFVAGAVVVGAVVVECVMRTGVRVPPGGAAPASVSEDHFFAASKASARELKISV